MHFSNIFFLFFSDVDANWTCENNQQNSLTRCQSEYIYIYFHTMYTFACISETKDETSFPIFFR